MTRDKKESSENIEDLENIMRKQNFIHSPDYMAISIEFILDEKLSYAARGLGTFLTYLTSQHMLFEIEDYPENLIQELIDNGYLRGDQ